MRQKYITICVSKGEKMIYTITFNPALDYVIKAQNLKTGKINKSQEEYIFPGGKGINVSIVLKILGQETTAMGFISGFVGKEIEKQIQKYGVETDFIEIENDNSRINVKILEENQETAINAKGPYIEQKYLELLYKKLEKIKNEDILILSGSVPNGVPNDIYEKICQKVKNKNIKIVVDSTGELLIKTLKHKPYLIKPNQQELEEIFGIKISNQDEALEYAKQLKEKGAQNVIVSMGSDGAVLLDENGYSYKIKALNVKDAINTVGAGDSMVAGFLAGYLVKLLNKLLSNFPEDFQSIKKLLIIPVISTFVVGIVMLCVVSVPMAWLNQGLTGFIDGLGTQNLVLTGMVIGGMMAVDLGGPINKVAYTFAVAAISNGNYYPMAAAMVGGVVPPLGVALATTLFKKKFTKDQQIQGKTYYLLGASFITESCMPVALTDPVRMIPAGIIGSAVAGGLAMLFQISLPAPHGGIFVTPVVEGAISQKLLYLAAITIGMLVSALIIGFTKKPLKEQEA